MKIILPLLVFCACAVDISRLKAPADQILAAFGNGGSVQGQTFSKLAEFTDTVGNRVSGSANLDKAVQYMLDHLKADGLENVHGEPAMVPRWVRGREYAKMHSPREYDMVILGLGGSVGTYRGPITAEVLVVRSFAELTEFASEAAGKIVVFNQQCNWTADPDSCYGDSVNYRVSGASAAAAVGAVAALVRTVGAFSIGSPHTGGMVYSTNLTIPTACITIEDANAFQRMQARGQKIIVELYMEARMYAPVVSHNVVAEWRGSKYPNEVVIVSGHLDSWDVGVGAMDDGGGAVSSWQVLSTLRQLNLRAKRTIRLVMWTCEEFDGVGSLQYYKDHKAENATVDLVMESDMGAFGSWGIGFSGSPAATRIMKEIVTLLAPINASRLIDGGSETDNGWWRGAGVPTGTLENYNDRYFWYHHSNGDQMDVFSQAQLDYAAAAIAVTAYAVADLDTMLPR